MKITRLEPIPVEVPLKQGMSTKTAHGEHVTSPYVMLKVHTDEGVGGLGEATVAPRWSGETSRGCVAVIEDLFEPALAGSDPTDIVKACATIDDAIKLNPFAKSAVEMALWDILGKVRGKPVYDLLGGKVREPIPIKMVGGACDVEAALVLARKFLYEGFGTLKVKVGLDVEGDVERVAAVRELAGPDIPIGVDANCGWNVADAIRALKEMEHLNILFAEQPVGRDAPTQMAEERQATSIPVMADESVFTPAEAVNVVRENAAERTAAMAASARWKFLSKNPNIRQTSTQRMSVDAV